jgi:hypothetical protein
MATPRLYGAVHFRYDPISEAAIFTQIGADGSEPVSTLNALPIIQVDATGRTVPQMTSAFGEQIVAQLSPQFQVSFEYTVSNTEVCTNTVTGSGTVTQADAMAVVATGTTTGSVSRLESAHHARYRPGMGGVLRFSGLFSTPVAGTKQYYAIADEIGSSATFKNGLGIGYNGTTLSIARWQNDALIETAQSGWDDKLDGTGASGVTLDPTKLNVFYITFQYLGAGPMFFWMIHPDTGVPFIFHVIKYGNSNVVPSTYMPNFSYFIYANNGATTSNIVLKSGSYAYFVEGMTTLIDIHQPQNSSGTKQKTTVTTEVAILTIRNKATFASKTNHIDILLEKAAGSIEAASANNLGEVRLVKNATIGGVPSWSDINTTNSIIEIDTSGTTVTGGKELIDAELAGKNAQVNENLVSYEFIIHPGETVTIAGSSANSATIRASILWRELI